MVKRKSSNLKFYFKVYRAVKEELVARGYNLKGKNKEFRAYLKSQILPNFPTKKRFAKKQIKNIVNSTINDFEISIGLTPTPSPFADYINPLLIPLPLVSGISWFLLDDFLDTELRAELEAIDPIKGLRVEVNAGSDLGTTGIFNLREYEYDTSGLKQIIENIREFVNNDSTPEWNGQIVVRRGFSDNGFADSYYLQLTLYVNGQEITPFESGQEAFMSIPELPMEDRRERRRKALKIKKEREVERRKRSKQKEKECGKDLAKKKKSPKKNPRRKKKPVLKPRKDKRI